MLKDSFWDYNFKETYFGGLPRGGPTAQSVSFEFIYTRPRCRIFALKVNIIYHVSLLVCYFSVLPN